MASRFAFFALAFGLLLSGLSTASKASGSFRQVDMGCYTVVSNLKSERALRSWISEFDQTRRAAQQLLGIKDEQILPLTIIVLDGLDDLRKILPPGAPIDFKPDECQALCMTVGMGRQPMIALAKEWGGASDLKMRSATVMWLMSSAGVAYDHWVVQGFLDLFCSARIKPTYIRLGGSNAYFEDMLIRNRQLAAEHRFGLGRDKLERGVAWAAMDYLLLGDGSWRGMQRISAYEQRVARGQPMEEAFAAVFGHSALEMDGLIQAHLREGRFHEVKVPCDRGGRDLAVELKPMSDVLWNLIAAQFMMQERGTDREAARRMIDRAVTLLPDDPRPYEARWLYGVVTNQNGLAATALTEAVKLGTKNSLLRLQWCAGLIDESFLNTWGFAVAPDDAVKAADTIEEIIAINPDGMVPYRVLAQVIPSIHPARPQDFEVLDRVLQSVYGGDRILELGQVAWLWRNGQLDAALTRMKTVVAQPAPDKFARDFTQWLQVQLATDARLGAIDAAVARGAYDEAARLFEGLPMQRGLMPFLKERLTATRMDMDHYDLTVRARTFIKEGQSDLALTLLQTMHREALPPWLQTILDELLVQAGASAPRAKE